MGSVKEDLNHVEDADRRDEDVAAFAEAVRDVKPLPPSNLADLRRLRLPHVQHSAPSHRVEPSNYEDGCVAKEGIQRSVLRKIRNGQIAVEDELDLHGFTVEQAEEKLRIFLQQNRIHRQRVVRVIHGKGHGSPDRTSVLRTKISEWLLRS